MAVIRGNNLIFHHICYAFMGYASLTSVRLVQGNVFYPNAHGGRHSPYGCPSIYPWVNKVVPSSHYEGTCSGWRWRDSKTSGHLCCFITVFIVTVQVHLNSRHPLQGASWARPLLVCAVHVSVRCHFIICNGQLAG